MQVKDLIKTLGKCDPEAKVYIRHHAASYSPVEWTEHNIKSKEVWLHHVQASWAKIKVRYIETDCKDGTHNIETDCKDGTHNIETDCKDGTHIYDYL